MRITDIVPWRRSQAPIRSTDGPFAYLQQEMNRLFDEVFEKDDGLTLWREGRLGKFNPRVDVVDKDQTLEVTVELPGLEPEQIEINLTADALIIKGEKKEENKEESDDYYHIERHYGSFYRTIPLPHDVVKENEVKSSFKNGVLTITLPKRKEAQKAVRRIPIEQEE